jgi:hypothetical protein
VGVSASAPQSSTRERPILFSAPMVRAIIAGKKTVTRRVVKPQPKGEPAPLCEWSRGVARTCGALPSRDELDAHSARLEGRVFPFRQPGMPGLSSPRCPYGAPGDTLWVRETWCREADPVTSKLTGRLLYRATDECEFLDDGDGAPALNKDGTFRSPWCPSIHMPRCASRLTLRVTGVRVERLQEISEEDARAEGVQPVHIEVTGCPEGVCGGGALTAREQFGGLWDSINGKRAPWASNPWVWCVSFERIDGASQ